MIINKLLNKCLYIAAVSFFLLACSSGAENGVDDEPTPPQPEKPTVRIPIGISTSITRVTETAFESGDRIGLYVVNLNDDGSHNDLKPSGNYVDNMRYTYSYSAWSPDETVYWTPDETVYWKDNKTCADFYLYYPYQAAHVNENPMVFKVEADQSNVNSYKNSDVIIGSTLNVAPSQTTVYIASKHVMSQVIIDLKPGEGFTDASLAASDVKVTLNIPAVSANIDLATGKVKPIMNYDGESLTMTPMTPYKDGNVYRVIVVPQEVAQTNLIKVNVGGSDFLFSKDFNFESGKSYTFNVTLAKESSGLNATITGWDSDGVDYGGTATEE
ncbi:fimbrillin family protein [Prevotella sp.]|uniref:fimbrillin family protein n=1 Tax=Prevotella sp. TaxID=59823 RepID=UPI003F7DCF75